jgi:hypothetical protein
MFSQHLDLPGSEDMCTNKIRVSRSGDYLRLLIIYNVDKVFNRVYIYIDYGIDI